MKNLKALLIVTSLGYFVDIYDLVLFSIVRVQSLTSIGVPAEKMLSTAVLLINSQMIGMLVGGIIWGILGDKRGRLTVLFGSILLYSIANIANAFVDSINAYVVIRFIAGIGLAGELGAGITLISETMSKETRGYGTMLIASIGLLGAIFAAFIADHFSWQNAYLIGGGLGLILLLLRLGVRESNLYNSLNNNIVNKGNIKLLFTSNEKRKRYLNCVLIGLPVWFVVGILISFSPEIAKAIGISEKVSVGTGIMYCYLGLAIGDVASGLLSQLWKSRMKVIKVFLFLTLLSTLYFLFADLKTSQALYTASFLLGFSVGYWALFVSISSEQFGTNIRSTVTTTVPNFVRAAVVPLTLSFTLLKDSVGVLNSAFLVGIVSIAIALFAAFQLKETFARDLNFIEE